MFLSSKIELKYSLLVQKSDAVVVHPVHFSFYILAVVYLDADTIVVKNIEDLFKCQKFCANLKHSERLNSGVMVVEPSEKVFKDMSSKINTMYSYTGGMSKLFYMLNSILVVHDLLMLFPEEGGLPSLFLAFLWYVRLIFILPHYSNGT